MRVFITQIGLQKVTAVAPAIMLLQRALRVEDIEGKCSLKNGLDDSYL